MKLNPAGGIVTTQVLGGHYHDNAYSISETKDGGYIVAGSTASTDGIFSANHGNGNATFDYYLVKVGNMGGIEWQKIYGGSENDEAYSVQQTTDGGYIVAGYSTAADGDVMGKNVNDYWILKLKTDGTIAWQKNFGSDGDESANSIRQTTDGGYIILGRTRYSPNGVIDNHNPGTSDFWIVKTDNIGNLLWEKCFGGGSFDDPAAIKQTADGGYITVGSTFSNDADVSGNHGLYDYWMLKLK